MLGIYNQESYRILNITNVDSAPISALPIKLVAQLQKEELKNAIPSFYTVVHDAEAFHDLPEGRIDLNVLFHSYAFYDAKPGEEHRTFAPVAVYRPEGQFGVYSLHSSPNYDFLAVDPDSIFSDRCKTEVYIHPRDGVMCCSPNNAKVALNTHVPVCVFYTLCLIPYRGSIARLNISRHILVADQLSPLAQEAVQLCKKEEGERIAEVLVTALHEEERLLDIIMRCFNKNSAADTSPGLDFLCYCIWYVSGQPNINDFGFTLWTHHYQQSMGDSPLSAISKLWMHRVLQITALELIKWLHLL